MADLRDVGTIDAFAAQGWEIEADDAGPGLQGFFVLRRPHPTGGTSRYIELCRTLRSRRNTELAYLADLGRAYDAHPGPVDHAGLAQEMAPTLADEGIGIANIIIRKEGLDAMTLLYSADRWGNIHATIDAASNPREAAEALILNQRRAADAINAETKRLTDSPPPVERATIVALLHYMPNAAGVAKRLRMSPPNIILTSVDIDGGVYATRMLDATAVGIVGSPFKLQRSKRKIWGRTQDPAFRFNGVTFTPDLHATIPESAIAAYVGRDIHDVVRHPSLLGTGLIVDAIWSTDSGRQRPRVRIKVRSDPVPYAEVRAVAQEILSHRGAEA